MKSRLMALLWIDRTTTTNASSTTTRPSTFRLSATSRKIRSLPPTATAYSILYIRRNSRSSPSLQELKCLFGVIFANFLIFGYKGRIYSAKIRFFLLYHSLVLDKICLNYARNDDFILPFREKVVPLQIKLMPLF